MLIIDFATENRKYAVVTEVSGPSEQGLSLRALSEER